jgi:uncharacterized protein YbjT (DUF2867 family)
MEVVIAGGHGAIARRLTRLLAQRGDMVRAMIRNPDQADDVTADGAEPLVVDLETAATEQVALAIAGADALVFAAGAGPGSGPERKVTVDRNGAIKFLGAAKRAGIHRFLIVSSSGAESPPEEDDDFSVYLRAKAAADHAVMATRLDWVVLRPGRLSDDPGTGKVQLNTDPPGGPITRDDVAGILAAALADQTLTHKLLYAAQGRESVEQALEATRSYVSG